MQFCEQIGVGCAQGTPLNRSFMHLHLGFDAACLSDLEMHHIIVNSWAGGVDTEQVHALQVLGFPTLVVPSQLVGLLKLDVLHSGRQDSQGLVLHFKSCHREPSPGIRT